MSQDPPVTHSSLAYSPDHFAAAQPEQRQRMSRKSLAILQIAAGVIVLGVVSIGAARLSMLPPLSPFHHGGVGIGSP
jgi:hypothetical protein